MAQGFKTPSQPLGSIRLIYLLKTIMTDCLEEMIKT